jgi:hypothetical protein
MKTLISITLAVFVLGAAEYSVRLRATPANALAIFEYATIRWGGRENTQVIRPNGKVEMLAPLLAGSIRPDRTDDRSFYMNISMNALAKEGFEFSGMTSDEIVMKRQVR